MITFRLARHTMRPDVGIVEVWNDDRMLATITPGQDEVGPSVRVISKHIIDVLSVPGEPQVIAVTFDD